MSLSDILTMRNELLLTFLAMILLTIDLNLNHAKKSRMIPISIGLFLVITLIGFIASTGSDTVRRNVPYQRIGQTDEKHPEYRGAYYPFPVGSLAEESGEQHENQ